MPMATPLAHPIRTPFLIHASMKGNSGGEITELAVNIIAESMNAQCDVNGNEYLLSEALTNQRKNGSALSVEDKKIVVKG